ncbi:MAG: prolyl oligopeptidase family serine peptidase [Myxococcota bacterium]|nr:prolyl oligopeptidase family serine peptidase [Myxococcota bacterium]
MKKKTIGFTHSTRRCAALVLAILVFGSAAPTVVAEVIPIDPNDPPVVTLPPADAELLQTLMYVSFPFIVSTTSPNGRHLFFYTPEVGLAFIDVHSGETLPVDVQVYSYRIESEIRWLNNRTLTYLGTDYNGQYHRILVDRQTGAVTATPVDLPGFPVSLSNGADKVVLARVVESTAHSAPNSVRRSKNSAPIRWAARIHGFRRPGEIRFDYEDRLTVPVATEQISLVVYDINTAEEAPLVEKPIDTGLYCINWSPRDRRLALITTLMPDTSRSGMVTVDSPDVQDALGNLPPEENPFFNRNVLDLFRFDAQGVGHQQLRPDADSDEAFGWVEWDPTGMVFTAQMFLPGTPAGRTYPSYANPNGSTYRVYLANGRLLRRIDRDEVAALYAWAYMVSPIEILFHTPSQMDFSLYHYNIITRKLRRLPTPAGSVHQTALTPRRREIVFNFSSYQQPPELFRLKLDYGRPMQLTDDNDELRDLNQIDVRPVQFTLKSGAKRGGYLLLPDGEETRLADTPLIVWQEGGPTAPMVQEWGNIVERPFNLLTNFDFAMLIVPLPGRDGFGPEFQDALADSDNFGQIDIDEQVEIVDQLIAAGQTTWAQTGVTGCSYGGYFSTQSITSYTNTYAAANPQCSLLDLFFEWEMGYTGYITYLMGRTPEDEAEYHRDSPLSRGGRVDTPTLIFAGTDDFLPADFSRQFHDQIVGNGTPADFYEFLGEPHGLYQATSQFIAGQAQLEWFREYLKP